MAKDRNAFAKRPRAADKNRKTNQNSARLESKQQNAAGEPRVPNASQVSLSPAEHAVLTVFRTWLMTPGKMLCFGVPDLKSFRAPLTQLTNKGLLVAERFHGGYSLTETGFAAMKDGE